MSKAYQFPHDEPNPFAEKNDPQPEAGQNPYAASVAPVTNPAHAEGAYQETLPARTGWIIGLAVTSMVGSLLSLALSFFCLPLGVFVLMLSGPTVAMAQHDLRAMKAGAMASQDRGAVKTSMIVALVASIVSVVSLAIPVGMLLWTVTR